MTVIIYGLFHRVSAKQTRESLKYGYTGFEGQEYILVALGNRRKLFLATNTILVTSIHSICSIVHGPMDALTSRLNSNNIHHFSKLRQLKPLRINHLFDLRLIDTPVLMHVPNVSTYIQINVNTVLPQRVQGYAVWGRLTP